MTSSGAPVLTAGPQAVIPDRFSRILFPTDFEEGSKRVLEALIPFARRLGAQVTVFHSARIPSSEDVPLVEPHAVPFAEGQRPPSWRRDHERLRLAAEAYVDHALVLGVRSEALFDFSGRALVDVLLSVSGGGRYDLIALPSRSGGALSSFLGGSTRAQLIRRAPCPVWLCHERSTRHSAGRAAS